MSIEKEKLKHAMSLSLKQPVARLLDETPLTNLVGESLMLVEMVIGLQEEFGVRLTQEQLKDVKTVGDLCKLF